MGSPKPPLSKLNWASMALHMPSALISWQYGTPGNPVGALEEVAKIFSRDQRKSHMHALIDALFARDDTLSDAYYRHLVTLAAQCCRSLRASFDFDLIAWDGTAFLGNQIVHTTLVQGTPMLMFDADLVTLNSANGVASFSFSAMDVSGLEAFAPQGAPCTAFARACQLMRYAAQRLPSTASAA